ncbi:unnamed protein product [Fusarium fujikuroi]|uniref:Uncharacterized protein n=1 Tax=Fusarium fujikuroi TaxID=5127 RepID=A0A9Q9UGJ7_FUSFU|nr:unnamed protein product [Fusarium fujikuroi]
MALERQKAKVKFAFTYSFQKKNAFKRNNNIAYIAALDGDMSLNNQLLVSSPNMQIDLADKDDRLWHICLVPLYS